LTPLAVQSKLADDERKELLPSGRQAKFDNRVNWVVTHLKKAHLLESTGRGTFRITNRGLEVLKNRPAKIDLRFLNQFPEFVEFRNLSRQEKHEVEGIETGERTPEEILEASYQTLRQNLQQELLELVKTCSPKFFENLVVDLLVAMGYGGSRKDAGEAVGRSGDGGIDGIIKEDRLGLDVVYIQAKRWQGTVGRPEIQAFTGSLEGARARKGVFITTSTFTPNALDYVSRIEKKIVLIDGQQLAQFMVDYDIGVTEMARYVVKKIDLDYFSEE
jgi:restriction system protein